MGKNYIAWLWFFVFMLCSYTRGIYTESDPGIYDVDKIGRSVHVRGGSNNEIFGYEDLRNTEESKPPRHNRVSLIQGRLHSVGYDASSAESGNRGVSINSGNLLYPRGNNPKISKYISYREATHSSLAVNNGIKNDPNEHQLAVMINLGVNFFDKLREYYANPLYITSFFRNSALNKIVGGALFSDHMANGDSAGIDIDMDGKYGPTNNEIFHHVKNNMEYYKLIAEFPKKGKLSWVHISYSTINSKNKQKNVYIAVMNKTRKVYLPYSGNELLVK